MTKSIEEIKRDFKIVFTKLMQDFDREVAKWDNAMGDFMRNMKDLQAVKQNDKYYHAKANCEASQRGKDGEAMAYILSYFREISEGLNQVLNKGKSIQEVYEDSLKDIEANKKGIECAKENPDGDCGEILKEDPSLYN